VRSIRARLEDFSMSEVAWSDDRVTILKSLWLEGVSASQIAKQLGGVTRNAVIGKVHRLGLSGRGDPSAPSRAPRVSAARRERPARLAKPLRSARRSPLAPTPTAASATPEGPGLVDSLVHLTAHACKWPIGDPKGLDFSFCDRRSDGRYCADHERLGVRPGTAWRADQDPIVRRALAGRL
jgi:GcrA cell cycle regulator